MSYDCWKADIDSYGPEDDEPPSTPRGRQFVEPMRLEPQPLEVRIARLADGQELVEHGVTIRRERGDYEVSRPGVASVRAAPGAVEAMVRRMRAGST